MQRFINDHNIWFLKNMNKIPIVTVDVLDIDPYGNTHGHPEQYEKCWRNEACYNRHLESIDCVIKLIEEGHKILPVILADWQIIFNNMGKKKIINNTEYPLYPQDMFAWPEQVPKRVCKYKRMDGYSRYMAYKLLGYKTIECYYAKNELVPLGAQHKLPWLMEDVDIVRESCDEKSATLKELERKYKDCPEDKKLDQKYWLLKLKTR